MKSVTQHLTNAKWHGHFAGFGDHSLDRLRGGGLSRTLSLRLVLRWHRQRSLGIRRARLLPPASCGTHW